MWSWIKRVGGTIIGLVLIFLSFGDAPQQLRNWKDGWDWFVSQFDFSGTVARWTFVIVAALVFFWAWDVPVRVFRKVRPEWQTRLQALWAKLSKPKPDRVTALQHGMFAGFDHIDKRFTEYASKDDVQALMERLQKLELATGNDPLQKMMIAQYMAMQIQSARYGVGEEHANSVDVSEVLEGYIKDNRIDILVNNDTMKCHPFAGQKKKLFVWYSVNGSGTQKVVVEETHKLLIPPTEPLPIHDILR
ncbi:MAG TPA: hypothetical protein VI485_17400 [Vicinamibacterales bacterium]|nr:hypothetical protein [Vicinamibacterales bacterium]